MPLLYIIVVAFVALLLFGGSYHYGPTWGWGAPQYWGGGGLGLIILIVILVLLLR
jgi:hypothetical protein